MGREIRFVHMLKRGARTSRKSFDLLDTFGQIFAEVSVLTRSRLGDNVFGNIQCRLINSKKSKNGCEYQHQKKIDFDNAHSSRWKHFVTFSPQDKSIVHLNIIHILLKTLLLPLPHCAMQWNRARYQFTNSSYFQTYNKFSYLRTWVETVWEPLLHLWVWLAVFLIFSDFTSNQLQ